MEIDEEDDFYAPEEDVSVSLKSKVKTESVVVGSKVDEEGLEEGEEDEAIEEDSDSVCVS